MFVSALVTRLLVAAQLWRLPLVRTPRLDSFEFVSWARRLASGDFAWPVVSAHGPGYPFFLAGLLTMGSGSLGAAVAMQAALGALTAVLVAVAAREWFGSRAGFMAGLAYALYGPAVYVDTALLAEGLLLALLALALVMLARVPVTAPRAAAAGAVLGAATLVRPTALLIAAACVVWLVWRERGGLLAPAGWLVAAAVLVVSPALAKNWSVSRTIAIQGYGGVNVYIGNSPRHDGRAQFRLGGGWDALNTEASRAGISDPAAQDRYYVAKAFAEIARQPIGYLKLLGRKALWLVQAEESRDSHSYYFFVEHSPLLRVLPRMAILFPLACVGFVVIARPKPSRYEDNATVARNDPATVARTLPPSPKVSVDHHSLGAGGQRRGASLLMCYTVAAAMTAVLLVVGTRYRMPLVPALAIAAGVGLSAILDAAAARRTRELAIDGAVAVAAIVVGHLLSDPRNRNVAEEWAFNGSSLITEHNLPEAEAAYRHALALDPDSGLAWDGLGLAQYDGGHLREARESLRRALALDPENGRALFHLALVDEREGKNTEAVAGYQKALTFSPHDAEIGRHLGGALGMAGRSAEGRDVMRHVVELTPRDGEAWLDLCLLSLDAGDVQRAATALEKAREFGAGADRIAFAARALDRLRP